MNTLMESLLSARRVVRRAGLLGAASLAALGAQTLPGLATSVINGGGATQEQVDYMAEMSLYNTGNPSSAQWGTYWGSGATAGQTAFLNDDLTCDINKVTGANGGNCSGGAGVGQPGNTVDYGASDGLFSSTQISAWQTYQYGQDLAGDLIQLPAMGVGMAIPVQNSAITKNGALILSDGDLCGVFSGKLTDFSQLTLGAGSTRPAAGPITVLVRSDGAGATFLLTNHLSAVCTTGAGGNSNVAFVATTTFASLFPNSTLPANFTGEKGTSALADALQGLTSAIGYLTPDYTTIDPNSGAQVNGAPSTLVVAAILNGKKAELPTTSQITAALARASQGSSLTPPATAAEGSNPNNWVPLIQTASAGYPIVGYAALDFAQCYADKTIGSAIIAFLNDHYTNKSYLVPQNNNGFVAISNSGAAKFLTAIRQHILANKAPGWNEDIDDKTVCKHLAGR
jgi:hypothetical protein